ncbi:MAG: ribosome small subunit-dependent GTPase A [bacterium]|nr:ribosome small subunit-dependent GTPase A [bacterium]
MNSLINLGWNSFFEQSVSEDEFSSFFIARVTDEQRGMYRVITEQGEFPAVVSGKFRYKAEETDEFPTVGDWVLARGSSVEVSLMDEKLFIERILPRKSVLSRKLVDGHTPDKITAVSQPIVSNIDTVFIMSSLNNEFNPRRLERYISLAWNSNAVPVILLSKADLCSEIQGYISLLYNSVQDVDVQIISTLTGQGLENLSPYLIHGKTSVIIGSSGVGKSTLINALFNNDLIPVKDIRSDDKGKHTTTSKTMYFLPSGGIIIDTPGIRGLQIIDDSGSGTSKVFDDIEELIQKCRFKNCTHKNEPGCAVKEALESGELEEGRYLNYLKIQKEITFLEERKQMKTYLKSKKLAKRDLAEKYRRQRKERDWQ